MADANILQPALAAAASSLVTEIETEVFIAAPPDQVWQALTAGVHHWWAHSYSEQPHAIALEARIGGRFYEAFDAQGNGALFATVTYCDPPRQLKYIGTMGMARPVLNQSRYELVEQPGGTLLKKRMEVFGVVPPDLAQGYDAGSRQLMACLKAYVEEGTRVR